MTPALGYLFLLLPVVAIAWIVWSYRQRTGDKEAQRREREAALVGMLKTAGKSAGTEAAAPAGAMPAATATVAAPAPLAVAVRRERFLSQPETLVYYLLRSGVPGYEVFPRVSLDLVLAGPRPHSARVTAQSAQATHDLDFVVCDKSMRIVAAIQLKGRLPEPEAQRIARDLALAGVRLVTFDPGALPKREQVSALIGVGAG